MPKQVSVAADPPLKVTIVPANPTAGDDLRIETSVEEIDSCRWRLNSEVLNEMKVSCLPRGNFAKGDVIIATIVANGRESAATVTVRNSPPKVTGVTFVPAVFHRGIDLVAEVQAIDQDGDDIRHRLAWVVNGEVRVWEDGPVLAGDRFNRGDRLALQVIPFDGEEEGEVFRTKEIVVPNAPPHFISTPAARFEGEKFLYATEADDPDGAPLLFAIEQAPPGLTIDPQTGRVIWNRCVPGEYLIRIVARDEQSSRAEQEFRLTIRPSG